MAQVNITPIWPGWETVRLLGRGSFGAVYEIRREVLGETERAAMKFLSVPWDRSEITELRAGGEDTASITRTFRDQMEGFANEYRLMRRLQDCPYVVRVDDVDCVQHDDAIGWDIRIKMELLTPLLDVLGQDFASGEEGTVRLGLDICRALVACARWNIIHRDIKPQNIFRSDAGVYKLGDFGIARIKEQQSSTATSRVGTFAYMAPEVYKGEHYDASADVYSLGLVLYWLMNGRRLPFIEANTPEEREAALRRRMSGEALPEPARGSEGLRRIIRRACAFRPENRYGTAAQMLSDLEELSRGEFAAPPEPSPGPAMEPASDPEPSPGFDPEKTVVIPRPSRPAPEPGPGAARSRSKAPALAAILALCLAAGFWLYRSGALRREPTPPTETTAPTTVPTETTAPTAAPTETTALTAAPTETPVPGPDAVIAEGKWSYGSIRVVSTGERSVYLELTDDRLPDGYPMSPTKGKNEAWWNVIFVFSPRYNLHFYINQNGRPAKGFGGLPTSLYLTDHSGSSTSFHKTPKYTLRDNTFCVDIPLPENFAPKDIQAVYVNLGTEKPGFSDHHDFYPS